MVFGKPNSIKQILVNIITGSINLTANTFQWFN